MANPIKIIEISGTDWLSGISVVPYTSIGGLFQQATNFDPFYKIGTHTPSLGPTEIGSGATIAENIEAMIGYSADAGSVAHIICFANSSKAYDINTDDSTVSDQSANVNNLGTVQGAIKYKGRAIYASDGNVYSNQIPLVASQTTILSGLSTAPHVMKIGPDRNLYVTNKDKIARITNVDATTDNAASYLSFESDVVFRGLDDDGTHLVIVGDTNSVTPSSVLERNRCFVAFWNMKSQDLTKIWDFEDSSVGGVVCVENEVLIIGATNVYTCSVNSRPVPLLPGKENTSLLQNVNAPGAITKNGSIALWGVGVAANSGPGEQKGAYVRGYGRRSPHTKKTLFTAYSLPEIDILISTAIRCIFMGSEATSFTAPLWISTDNTKLYKYNTSNMTSTTKIAGIDLKQPYEFSFAKVILSEKLASGQSVDLEIKTDEGNNTVLKDSKDNANRFSFATVGGKKSHIFYPESLSLSASSVATFEDLSDIQIRNIGASIRRVEVWAKPIK